MANLHIRTFEMRDYEQVTALWRAAGLSLSLSDDVSGIEHRMTTRPGVVHRRGVRRADRPALFWAATTDGEDG